MKRFLAALLLTSLVALPAMAQPIDAKAGKPVTLHLDGNPSTGYTWQLVEDESSGLDLVELQDLGWSKAEDSSAKVGSPQVLSIEVTPLQAGDATLVYGYLRPWEDEPPAETQSFEIHISDK